MRRLLFNVHLYLALAAGVFVIILGVTGSIMAFEPELDHLLHSKTTYVKPAGEPLPLAKIGEAAAKEFPGERISGYLLSTDPGISYAVSLRRGVVYVNQYTGEVLGVRAPGPDFLSRVHQLHLRLLLQNRSDPGKLIMSCVGVVILFLLVSGIYLWWPVMRVTVGGSPSGRRFWFDLHNTVGVFSFVFLFLLAFTGVMIGFEAATVPLFYKMTGSAPSEQPQIPTPPPGAHPISPDQAIQIARDAIPGATPFQINIPGPKAAYQVRSRFPEDLTPGGRSRVVIDQYTGKVIFAEGSRTAPAGSRIVIQNRALHTGDILGIPSKAVMSLASLAIVAQMISGFLMWWKRPRRKV